MSLGRYSTAGSCCPACPEAFPSLFVAALTYSCIVGSLLYNQDASCDLPAVLQELSATGPD